MRTEYGQKTSTSKKDLRDLSPACLCFPKDWKNTFKLSYDLSSAYSGVKTKIKKILRTSLQRWIIQFWYWKLLSCQFGLESLISNVFNIPIWFLEVSGSIWVISSSFCWPYPKISRFWWKLKIQIFSNFYFQNGFNGFPWQNL